MRMVCFAVGVCSLVAMVGCGPVVGQINEQGVQEYRSGRYVESIGLFKTALDKDPTRPSTLYYLGRSYTALAEQRFREGDARMARRNLDDAVYYFDRAIAVFPDYDEAIRGKNHALELRGEYDKAMDVVTKSADLLGPSARRKVMIAREQEQRGDLDAALRTYRQAVIQEPLNAWVHAEYGRFYRRLDRRDEAVDQLRRAYKLDPDEPGVVRDLKELGGWPVP